MIKKKYFTIFVLAFLLVGGNRVPFPANIPVEHFSYFQYPTDVLGFKDAKEGAEITPEGFIFTGYTEIIFMYGPSLSYFPLRKHYWLEDEYLPIHHWIYSIDGVEYKFEAFSSPIDLDPDRNLIIYMRIKVTNKTEKAKKAWLAVGTRYQPGESEGPGRYSPYRHRFRRPATPEIKGMYTQEGEKFNPDWKFKFEKNYLLRNGKILFVYSSNAKPILFSYPGYKTEKSTEFLQPVVPSSPAGIVLFSEKLSPGESIDVNLKIPYTPVLPYSMEAQYILKSFYEAEKERVKNFWNQLISQGMQIELPENKPVYVYKTSLIYDLIARDKMGDDYIQKVNEFQYDAFWLRDSSYIVRSYDLGGYHDIAKQCLEFFFRWQRPDGNFVSQGGQFDGWGQTLWAFGQHYRLTHDRKFAEKALKAIMKAADWLEIEMKKDPLGIMPVTTPGDNEAIKGGHITGHNFWALAGLKNAFIMADEMGKKEEALRLKKLYKKLRKNFLRVLNRTLKRTGNYIPPALDVAGGQDWGNLLAVYPEEILPPFHPAVTETLRRTRKKYREGLMTYGDMKYLHHYLTMKNTETEVIRGEQERVLEEFYSILAHTSSTQAGFEFSIHPWADRDFHANLTPHGWFAAKYRNLLRDMLIREQGRELHLMSVISPAWVRQGDRIAVKDAPTYFGRISYSIVFDEGGASIRLESRYFKKPERIGIHLPYFVEFVKADRGKLKGRILFVKPSIKLIRIKWRIKKDIPFYSFENEVKKLIRKYND